MASSGSPFQAWIDDVKKTLAASAKPNTAVAQADLHKLQTETDPAKRILLCNAFLTRHKALTKECDQVENLLAVARRDQSNAEGRRIQQANAAIAAEVQALHAEKDPNVKAELCKAFLAKHAGHAMSAEVKGVLAGAVEDVAAHARRDDSVADGQRIMREKVAAAKVDLEKIRAENQIDAKIALCDAFASKYGGLAKGTMDDLLSFAKKERGVAEAKKAYEIQRKGVDDPRYNPGNIHNFKKLESDATLDARQQAEMTKLGLTEGEALAVKTYTDNDYKYINPAVANQKDKADKVNEKGERVDWMDTQKKPDASDPDAVQNYLDNDKKTFYQEGAVHAGMVMEALKKMDDLTGKLHRGARMTQADFDKSYQVGKVIAYEAFASMSVAEPQARVFTLGDKDTPPEAVVSVFAEAQVYSAKDIQQLSKFIREKEWLIQPGTQLEVVDIQEDTEKKSGVATAPAKVWKKVVLKEKAKVKSQ